MATRIESDALTDLERVKRHLDIKRGTTDEDAYLIDLINAASQYVQRRLGHPVKQFNFDHSEDGEGLLWAHGGSILTLPFRPLLTLTYFSPDTRFTNNYWQWDNGDATQTAGGLTYGATDPVGDEGIQGLPTIGDPGYFGPCPPAGDPHTYHFRLYALAESPRWSDQPTAAEVAAEAEGALAVAETTGTFDRDG